MGHIFVVQRDTRSGNGWRGCFISSNGQAPVRIVAAAFHFSRGFSDYHLCAALDNLQH
jgi:hypothetical protein